MLKRIFVKYSIALLIFFSSICYALILNPNSSQNPPPVLPSDTFSVASSQLGLSGPLSIGLSHDNSLGYIWNAQYAKKITDHFALAGLAEYGNNSYRYGGTIGFSLMQNELLKFSAERLSQILNFNFDSGNVSQRMAQNAYGLDYQHVFNHGIFQDISLNGYYANTPNKTLDAVDFLTNGGILSTNYRNVAGGTSFGFNVGSDIKLSKYTALAGHVFYDRVYYNTINQNSTEDASGLGASLAVNQIINKHFKLVAEGSTRKIYDTLKFGISWLPPVLAKNGFELSLLGERIVPHNQTDNSNIVGLKLSFNSGMIGAKDAEYQLPDANVLRDLDQYVKSPAVHMEQVLAIADQRTVAKAPFLDPLNPITPSIGGLAGNEIIRIHGAGLSGATGVTFDGIPGSNFSVQNSGEIDVTTPQHAIGTVNVVVLHPAGNITTHFTYANSNKNTPSNTNVSCTPMSASTLGGDEITCTFTLTSPYSPPDTSIQPRLYISGAADQSRGNWVKETEPYVVRFSMPAYAAGIYTLEAFYVGSNRSGNILHMVDTFQYIAPPPVIESVTPNTGPIQGGTSVTIHGSNFSGATQVAFGNNVAQIESISSTQIVATSPSIIINAKTNAPDPVPAALLHITVTTPGGTSATSSADEFTYTAIPPYITSQPSSKSVMAPASATFSVVAAGDSGYSLNYQWYKNGTAIPNATNASYTTPATSLADSGATFYVVVSGYGELPPVQSSSATLTVEPSSLQITTQSTGAPKTSINSIFTDLNNDIRTVPKSTTFSTLSTVKKVDKVLSVPKKVTKKSPPVIKTAIEKKSIVTPPIKTTQSIKTQASTNVVETSSYSGKINELWVQLLNKTNFVKDIIKK